MIITIMILSSSDDLFIGTEETEKLIIGFSKYYNGDAWRRTMNSEMELEALLLIVDQQIIDSNLP